MATALLLAILGAAPQGPLGAALALEQEGRPREAVLALSALSAPEGTPLAGRIAFETARLTDAWLDDPLLAARLYDGYLASYPKGPYAGTAANRRDFLVANSGTAPEALAEFQDILRDFPRLVATLAIQRMEALVLRYPAFPLRARACFWLASVLRQRRLPVQAERWLAVVVAGYPGTRDARRAELAIADLESGRHHFARALAVYRKYRDSQDPLIMELARTQEGFTVEARLYLWLDWIGLSFLAALFLAFALGLVRRRASLFPLPWEARLFAPLAGLLVALTAFEDRKVGVAVLVIAAGGALFLVLQGAYLRVAAPRGPVRLAHLAASAGAAASLAYCAVYQTHLTELVVTTIEQGADR